MVNSCKENGRAFLCTVGIDQVVVRVGHLPASPEYGGEYGVGLCPYWKGRGVQRG